jgi:hypothetical protein
VTPDDLWAVSGNWCDMIIVKHELKVSRAIWYGLLRNQRDLRLQTGQGGALRVLVAPESEWAMRVMAIETASHVPFQYPTMQRSIHDLANHARAGLRL